MRSVEQIKEAMNCQDSTFERDEVIALLDFEIAKVQSEQIALTKALIEEAKAEMMTDATRRRVERLQTTFEPSEVSK